METTTHRPTRASLDLTFRAMRKLGSRASLATLMRETGLSVPTVSRCRRILLKSGKITDSAKGLVGMDIAAHLAGVSIYVLRALTRQHGLTPVVVGKKYYFDPVAVIALRKTLPAGVSLADKLQGV